MKKTFEDMKSRYPDAFLLFRCGDFYEAYNEDAAFGGDVLDITVEQDADDGTPTISFPFHALDINLPRLIRAGKRVAICDRLEKPKEPFKKESKKPEQLCLCFE
ncbi:MAG: hypothetical protein IKH59_01600 [Bacteroidaceae bacterium]|nr:hypothetical protein [Bacteroidaceae bacterium]